MKNIALFGLITVLTSAFAQPASAAQFKKITNMDNDAAQSLVAVAKRMARDENKFGSNSYTTAYLVSNNENQSTLNTAKQLNHMNGNLNSDDDSGAGYNNFSATQIADSMLEYLNDFDKNENRDIYDELVGAIEDVKADSNLKIFGTMHGDEDGTWTILDIIDTKNNQALYVQLGYSGT